MKPASINKLLSRSSFVLLILSIVWMANPSFKNAFSEDQSDAYRQLALFGDVFQRVKTSYVEEKSDKELIASAINGLLTSLDPHSSFLPEENYEKMQVETSGKFGGLGVEITTDNGLVKVVSPIDDTPAYKAGIKAGDLIIEIDSKSVKGLSLNEAVDLMRGKIGNPILVYHWVAEPLS